jgi:hypothetical protein
VGRIGIEKHGVNVTGIERDGPEVALAPHSKRLPHHGWPQKPQSLGSFAAMKLNNIQSSRGDNTAYLTARSVDEDADLPDMGWKKP